MSKEEGKHLEEVSMSTYILAMQEPNQPFIFYLDASLVGLGEC